MTRMTIVIAMAGGIVLCCAVVFVRAVVVVRVGVWMRPRHGADAVRTDLHRAGVRIVLRGTVAPAMRVHDTHLSML